MVARGNLVRWCIPLRSATNIIQSWGSSIQEAGQLFRVPITLPQGTRYHATQNPKEISYLEEI